MRVWKDDALMVFNDLAFIYRGKKGRWRFDPESVECCMSMIPMCTYLYTFSFVY
jgi:hypothetical protein